jgi:hypothetical protein
MFGLNPEGLQPRPPVRGSPRPSAPRRRPSSVKASTWTPHLPLRKRYRRRQRFWSDATTPGSTVFGNVLDLTGGGDAYVKRVSQEGGADSGYALLRIETADGVDLCFASYRPGRNAAGGLETDALQALVQMDGTAPRTLYLGGGTLLKTGDAVLERSEEGLAYVEKAPDGGYIVGNPSPTAATVTVKLAALHGLAAFDLDDEGKPRGGANADVAASREVSIRLEAAARVEFLYRGKVGQESLSH